MTGIGKWGSVLSWPIVGIHAVLTQSGKLFTFGTDTSGVQGGTMVHDLWDPVTGEHHLIDHHMDTPTDIFCAAAIILPGTNEILIAGGDARPDGHTNMGVDDVNLYDDSTGMIMPAADGTMNVARWYPTVVSLSSGQVVVMGGIDLDGKGQGTPEIYTPGEGWRLLTGAFDPDIVAENYYPKMWVGASGEIFYVANGDGPDNRLQLMALDPSGDGSIREVARLPFYLDWMSPAIMYDTGKVLMNDWRTGLWTIDLNTATPTVTHVAELSQDRNYSNMTVLADGTVLINGGTGQDNLEAYADTTAAIWNPATGTLTDVGDEAHARLYHSTSILLPDGSVMATGGGSASNAEHDFLDGQIYRPGYLFNADGSDATRPVVSGAPETLMPGDTFRITVDDADAITKLTFSKTGAVTHNLNMDARATTLAFTHVDAHTLEVRLPADTTAITAGSWMLFAWNAAGVPSVAPIIAVEPSVAAFDGIGDLTADTFAVAGGVTSLDAVDFSATPTARALVADIAETTGAGATRLSGSFAVQSAGSYTLYLGADASARLWVDGKIVLTSAGSATVALTAGTHALELRTLATGAQTGAIDLDWSGAAFARRQMTFDGTVDNLLANGSLERAANAAGLPGWTATKLDSHVSGDLGLQARTGSGFVEIDAKSGPLSQQVATVAGERYTLGLDVAGNPNGVASSRLEVVVNAVVIATIAPGDTAWHRYDLGFTGTGHDTVSLRAIAGDTDAIGALVDTVVLLGPKPDDMGGTGQHLMGTAGADMLMGGGGADTIMGMSGDDHLMGMGGNDVLLGGSGHDLVMGEDGDDRIAGGRGADTLDGGAGSDTVDYLTVAEDFTLDLAIRRGQLAGSAGTDRLIDVENLIGGRGANEVWGTTGANRLDGGAGADRLHGRGGDDVLVGGRDADLLDGGSGTDTADYSANRSPLRLDLRLSTAQNTRESGWDTLVSIENVTGGGGKDRIGGDGHANRLDGGAGDDRLFGRGGADVLVGGAGHDVLTGGSGRDLFLFASGDSVPGSDRDLITDFVRGEDRIGGTVAATSFIGTRAFGGIAGQVRYDVVGSTTIVQVDENGDKRADLEVGLSGIFQLANTDFVGLPAAAASPFERVDPFAPMHLSPADALSHLVHFA